MACRRPFPTWAMLDRFVRRRDDDSFPASNPTAASLANSRGDPFDVCLRLKEPPEPSSLYLRWPNGPKEGEPVDAAAAHGGAVLLLMHYTVPVLGGRVPFPMIDYLVYDPARSSLRLLPSLGGTIEEVKARAEADNLHVSKQLARRMESMDIGIVYRGPADLAVAELQIVADEQGTARPEVRVFNPSVSEQWVLKTPSVVPVHPRDGLDLDRILWYWDTDAVVPLGSCLCWVDYSRGVLLCNVFDEDSELFFLELPVKLPSLDRDVSGRGWLEAYHALGATKEGDVLKFARVLSDDAPPPTGIIRPVFGSPPNRFTVTTWSLKLSLGNSMAWIEDGSVTSDELRDLDTFGHLPQEIPMYPTFHLENPDAISFILKTDDGTYDVGEIWLVAVNVMKKTIESSMLYTKDCEDSASEDAELFERKIRYCEPFLSTELPKDMDIYTPSALYGEIASSFMETLETKPAIATHLPVPDQPMMNVCF